MLRVTLLVEETNERLRCLLNPESLVLRRQAGIQPRRSVSGRLTGAGLADDPLLYTGGGRTEFDLDLLFDVSLAGSSINTQDVRDLTLPLWRLAEGTNRTSRAGRGDRPPSVRFMWGKSWNIPAVVVAVAERLEDFTPDGVPRRSWLRMRLLRAEAPAQRPTAAQAAISPVALASLPANNLRLPEADVVVHEHMGGGVTAAVGVTVAAAPEPSIGEAVVEAADILSAAIAETPAGAWLIAASQRIADAVASITQDFKEWLAAPSPLTEAIKRGLRRLSAAASSLAAGIKAGVMTAVTKVGDALQTVKRSIISVATAAAAEVSAAVRRMAAALRRLTAPAERAIAAALAPILDNLRPLARAIPRAAGIIARAVRVRAARLIAAAAPYVAWGRQALTAALARIGPAISTAAAAAVAAIRDGAQFIGEALAGMAAGGRVIALNVVGPALDKIAAAADALWSAGAQSASEAIGKIVAGLANAFKNMFEAGETLDLVSGREACQNLKPAAEALQDAVQQRAAANANLDETVPLIADAWGTLEANAAALPELLPSAPAQPVIQAAAVIEAALPALDAAGPQDAAVAQVTAALAEIAAAAEPLAAALATATAQLVEAAAQGQAELPQPGAQPDPAASRPAAAPQELHLAQNERLDQIAFRYYADPALWRLLAVFNRIDHPFRLAAGQLLRVPPASVLGG